MPLEMGDLVVGLSGKVALTCEYDDHEGSFLLPCLIFSPKTRLGLAPPARLHLPLASFSFFFFFFLFFFFFSFFVFLPFLGPLPRHMEVPRLGVESESEL